MTIPQAARRATGQRAARVLLVEDDHALRDVVARALREDGLEVVTASDGRGALGQAAFDADAVVLDIGLPDADGRDVCTALRARGVTAPVLFLTARSELTDRLAGFAAGGDDYLVKPFHVAELLARVQVALRRSPGRLGDADDRPAPDCEDLELDPERHALAGPAGDVLLTPIEFRLLARLLRDRQAVVRRRDLVLAGWPAAHRVADNTLDQYASKLRRRLADAGSTRTLKAVRGVGYRLE